MCVEHLVRAKLIGGRERRYPAGFTLIELLVVIGIISVLISILLPALNKARSAAQAVTCMSRLRQAQLAIQMYANDNQNCYPPYLGLFPNDPDNHPWADFLVLNRYVLNPVVLRCPLLTTDSNGRDISDETFRDRFASYHLNTYGFFKRSESASWATMGRVAYLFRHVTTMGLTSKWPVLGDSCVLYPPQPYQQIYSINVSSSTIPGAVAISGTDYYTIDLRHSGRANISFADGHVASLSRGDLARLTLAGEGGHLVVQNIDGWGWAAHGQSP